jgi:archaellin
MNKSNPPLKLNEHGITALETAVILIAFVVAATMFAITVLSNGTVLTERSQEAAYNSLGQVRGAIELKGGVIAIGSTGMISEAILTISNVAGGQAIDFNTTPGQRVVVVEYRDERQRVPITTWSIRPMGYADGDQLLEERELFELVIPLTDLAPHLTTNTRFTLEVKPPLGAPLQIERTTPASIDRVMDLK